MHTPGNWWFDMNLEILNDPSGSVKIARVSGRNREEAKANAALIASAPDLLKDRDQLREQVRILREALAPSKDLLEHIVQRLSNGVQFWNTDMQAMRSRIASIREALEATKEGE